LDRKVDVAYIQETRWKGCKFCGAKGKRYQLFWMGDEERLDGVGIFIAEKLVDSVVSVERHSKRVLILKMILDNGLLNVLMVYAPRSGNHSLSRPSKSKLVLPFWYWLTLVVPDKGLFNRCNSSVSCTFYE